MADENQTRDTAEDTSTDGTVPAMGSASPVTPDPVSTDHADLGNAPGERPNNATTTVDDVTFAKAAAGDPNAPQVQSDVDASLFQTPAKVLEDAQDAAPVVSSNKPAEGDAPVLVVAPTLGDAMEKANADAVAPTLPNTTLVPDIGAGLADSANRTVVVAAPAQDKPTAAGTNAGAVDPTGYVAPVRVSAAGVPSDDPTVLAASAGDLPSTNATAPAAGTNDKPADTASLGAASSADATASRVNGSAQAQPLASVAGANPPVSPATGGDPTLTTPVPPPSGNDAAPAPAPQTTTQQAGDGYHLSGVAAGTDPNAPAPADAVRAAVDAANASDKPMADVNDPATARPVGEGSAVLGQPSGDNVTGQAAPLMVDHPVIQQALPAVVDTAPAVEATGDQPEVTVQDVHAAAAQDLHTAGLIPAPILADVKAQTSGPQSEEELDADDGDLYEVVHDVTTSTTYHVFAKSSEAAVQAVKDGKGVVSDSESDEDWHGTFHTHQPEDDESEGDDN